MAMCGDPGDADEGGNYGGGQNFGLGWNDLSFTEADIAALSSAYNQGDPGMGGYSGGYDNMGQPLTTPKYSQQTPSAYDDWGQPISYSPWGPSVPAAQQIDAPNYSLTAPNVPEQKMSLSEAQSAYDKTVTEDMTNKLGRVGLLGLLRGGPITSAALMAFVGIREGIKRGWNSYQVQQQMERDFPGEQITQEQAAAFTEQVNSGAYDSLNADGGLGGGQVGNQLTGGGTGGNMATAGGPTSLAEMALDLYKRTDPARQSIIDRGTNFLEGGLDVTQSPMWGSGKNAAETQYQLARDATMANLPGGGALQSALATGETDKARTLTDLASRIGMDEYSKIYGLASGAPQQSMSGMGMAGQTDATLAGQQMYQNVQEDAQKNQLYSDLGAGIGEGWGDK